MPTEAYALQNLGATCHEATQRHAHTTGAILQTDLCVMVVLHHAQHVVVHQNLTVRVWTRPNPYGWDAHRLAYQLGNYCRYAFDNNGKGSGFF